MQNIFNIPHIKKSGTKTTDIFGEESGHFSEIKDFYTKSKVGFILKKCRKADEAPCRENDFFGHTKRTKQTNERTNKAIY